MPNSPNKCAVLTTFFMDQAFGTAHSRPVLIILERHVDLSVNLHHPWTYEVCVCVCVCMCVCVCVCVCVHIYTYIHTYIYIHTYVYMYTRTHTRTHARTHAHTHTHTHTHTHKHVQAMLHDILGMHLNKVRNGHGTSDSLLKSTLYVVAFN
jgi:hypothetical protein